MKIATSPINWNNEDVPDYRPWIPYPEILDEIQKAGYRATEWSSSLPEDPERLKADLEARGLHLVGAFVALDLKDPARHPAEIARALEKARFLRALGARHLVVADAGDAARRAAAGHVGPELALTDAQLAALAEGLEALAERLSDLGMALVFHNHVGTYVETGEEIARLLEATDPDRVGWCLDTGHLVYGGGDLLALLSRFAPRVRYLHLKDVDPNVLARARAEGWSFEEALRRYIFAPLGEGMVPLREALRKVLESGYDGWAVIEQDTTPKDPTETARENRARLEALLRELGHDAAL